MTHESHATTTGGPVRSTAFDMIGMTLMALVVILACGVMFVWGYLRATRGRGDDASSAIAQTGTESSGATRAVPTKRP